MTNLNIALNKIAILKLNKLGRTAQSKFGNKVPYYIEGKAISDGRSSAKIFPKVIEL